jgi:hypothetical protein
LERLRAETAAGAGEGVDGEGMATGLAQLLVDE